MTPRALLLGALLLGLAASPAQAERFETAGDYRVHYNAFPSSLLTPEAAQAHQLMRSRLRGVLTVSVFEHGEPVAARVRATAAEGSGEATELVLREFRQAGAIYYMSNVVISDGDVLRFRVEVLPAGAEAPFSWRFSQQFFSD